METLLSICVGIGLSAACGFRVFVPLVVMSVAALTGHLTLAHGFEWVGSYPALIAFAVATCVEIAGYYLPWVDNLLDTIATPAAVIAGTLITASLVTDLSPFLKWTLAIIAGGGVAGMVQGTTVTARGLSSIGTGGLGNALIATAELAASTIASIIAVLAPLVAVGLLATFLLVISRKLFWNKTLAQPKTSASGSAGGQLA
jgi:uncharacterized protein DUF4126